MLFLVMLCFEIGFKNRKNVFWMCGKATKKKKTIKVGLAIAWSENAHCTNIELQHVVEGALESMP